MWTSKNRAHYDRSKLRYPSDLTDDEWGLVKPLIAPGKTGGGKRRVIMREVVNGLMYVLSTGCQWRAIPKDLPPKSTIHGYFDLWTYDGTLQRMHHLPGMPKFDDAVMLCPICSQRSGPRPPLVQHGPPPDAVHFRDSPTSTHSRDSIHSGENSDTGSERVMERDSLRFGGDYGDGLRWRWSGARPQSRQTLVRWKQQRR
jgi:Putative transposase of IS4/5 family (DUF4096)